MPGLPGENSRMAPGNHTKKEKKTPSCGQKCLLGFHMKAEMLPVWLWVEMRDVHVLSHLQSATPSLGPQPLPWAPSPNHAGDYSLRPEAMFSHANVSSLRASPVSVWSLLSLASIMVPGSNQVLNQNLCQK